MDLSRLTQYLNALVSSSILPSFKGFFDSSSKEIGTKLDKIEKALKERTDIDKVMSHVEAIKGEKGDAPTDEELIALIRPLIPEPIPGEDGHTPTDSELLALIKPLIPKVKDGRTPTKAELRELIKPLIPKPIKGDDGYTPVKGIDYDDGRDGSPDKPKDIVKKLQSLEGDDRLDASAIKGLEKIGTESKKLYGKAVKYLANLLDVSITSPANGEVLKYNSTTNKWENGTVAGGSGHTIQDEGTPLTARTNLNFVGAGVTTTDDAGNDATVVTISGGVGSGITRTVVVTSGSATMGSSASTDYAYFVAGAHTMSLPAAAGNTNRYTVKNNHSAAITVDTAGAETVEGAASVTLNPADSNDFISDGTNWFIV